MGLAPVSSSTASQGGSGSTSSLSQLGEDYTRFLTLLTAQIQYQDPLEPIDSTQFVSQLAQLSQVEQAVNTNSNLENLGGQLGAILSASGAAMLGRDVTVSSNEIHLKDGAGTAYYNTPEGTESVVAEIRDPDGNLVRSIQGLSTDSTELQEVNWDGLNDSGSPVLDGRYTMSLTALDADGAPVTAFTYRKAMVQEVLFTDGQNYFKLEGDETVPAEAVLAAS